MLLAIKWCGIVVCLVQSAMFSGLNLALYSLSKLELEVEAKKNDHRARRILRLRQDSNFALVTILWGNVAVNVLLALLSESVLAGIGAFLFSTVAITLFAEILPQAYFSRHALRVASFLAPMLRFYEFLLFPISKPTAWILDRWLGGEELRFFREHDLRRVIQLHVESSKSDIARMEGQGALNFLEIDDVPLAEEGEPLAPDSIVRLDFENGRPAFPPIRPSPDDPFLRQVQQSGRTWVILVDREGQPQWALHADAFLRAALFAPERFDPHRFCHRPIVVHDASQKLGTLIPRFRVQSGKSGTEIVEDDVLLLWIDPPRIVTGADILGRLLRGIAVPERT